MAQSSGGESVMSIDLDALQRMSQGDPTSKVMVSRKWLREVHRLLRRAALNESLTDLAGTLGKIAGEQAELDRRAGR